MFAPKRILVPTDFSETSDTALKKALDIAYQYKSVIYLLHVIDSQFYTWAMALSPGFGGNYTDDMDGQAAKAEEKMHEQMTAFALARQVEIIPCIKVGRPSHVIMSEQKKKNIDFIVIGSSKERGIFKRLLGGMADAIINRVPFPAMVMVC